jgi:hypothetical protein
MFELTDAQLVTLGIGGAVLIAGLLPHIPEGGQPITYKGFAIIAGVILGIVMLAVALVEMVTD